MELERITKGSFTVIGKEGSTDDGEGFIKKLWEEANSHFSEIAHLAKRDEDGNLTGIWGAMSDPTRSFKPWEDFRKGLYLAGAECVDGAEAPQGWTKWVVPSYEYLKAENDTEDAFDRVIRYLNENGIALAGAVHDFTCPATGRNYMYFPVRRL